MNQPRANATALPQRSSSLRMSLQTLQAIGWLLLVVLTPLWVNLWGRQPFELSKVMLMRTLVWFLAALTVAEFLVAPDDWRRKIKRIQVSCRGNPLLAPALLLALVVGVSTLTAVDWRLSLWGSYARSQGAITLWTYLLLFWLAAAQFSRLAWARTITMAMAGTAAPIVLLGLIQFLGWDPVGLVSDARSPAYATLGRANFVGAYLALLVPLTLALLLTARTSRRRTVGWLLLVGDVVGIGFSLARGAWIATALSLWVFAWLWWTVPRSARRSPVPRGLVQRCVAWLGTSLLMLGGPLVVLWAGGRVWGAVSARFFIWQGALALIAQRPLLGYGADALGLVFPAVYSPQLVYLQGRDVYVDRAHNLLLDWAVMAGVPGLLAWLLCLGAFVLVIWGALFSPQPSHTGPATEPALSQRHALLIGILAAVLGNVTNNLVSFDVTPTATAMWLLMGMGVALARGPFDAPALDAGTLSMPRRRMALGWRVALVGLLAVGLGGLVWQVNVRPLLADAAAHRATQFARTGDWAGATNAAAQAVAYWPLEPAHHFRLGQLYIQRAMPREAEASLQNALRLRPRDPFLRLESAQFYTWLATLAASDAGRTSDAQAAAHAAYAHACALAPNHAVMYAAWGRAALAFGDPEQAARHLRTAVALDASNGDAYIDLGTAELALGRVEVALADYHEAVRLSPESSRAYLGLARGYWHASQPQAALAAVDTALRLAPENAEAQRLRATIVQVLAR